MSKDKQGKQDKYSAVWLSHSSMSDFLKCPRLYYLRNIWKNKNGNKVNTVSPHLSLGLAVHQIIEPLALLKLDDRKIELSEKLLDKYTENWKKFSGIQGGFLDQETEQIFKERGLEMIKNILKNPGPLLKKTLKFYNGDFIPNIFISAKDNIILCGLVDWVEYIEDSDSLRVIDFKTGRNDEKEDSFQLPIYKILVESLQKRKVSGAAYWYLDRDTFPKSVELIDDDIEEVRKKIVEIGLDIKRRKAGKKNSDFVAMENNFACKYPGSCYACREFELIKNYTEDNDQIQYIGTGEYKQDLYLIKEKVKFTTKEPEETQTEEIIF